MSCALCQPDVWLVGGLSRVLAGLVLGPCCSASEKRGGAAVREIGCQAVEGHLLGQAADEHVIN